MVDVGKEKKSYIFIATFFDILHGEKSTFLHFTFYISNPALAFLHFTIYILEIACIYRMNLPGKGQYLEMFEHSSYSSYNVFAVPIEYPIGCAVFLPTGGCLKCPSLHY